MEKIKLFFIILTLFLPLILFSQDLEEKDIHIFINGGGQTVLNFLYSSEMDKWFEEYRELGANIINLFEKIIYDNITDEELRNLRIMYNNFLDYDIPENFKNLFKELNWGNNGHRNFNIIFNEYKRYIIVTLCDI